jgi:hypothetical protein
MRLLAPLLLLALLPACATTPRAAAPSAKPAPLTEQDRARLRGWRDAFAGGLAQARAAGHAEAIAREGALLHPDSALGGGIPDGTYRCRIIKLGARSPGMLPFVAYPAFTCRIAPAGERRQSFAKLTGSQRQVGIIRPHDRLRSLFLGTLVLGDERRAMPYGTDPERDLAGWVERIGERRWRLLLPRPAFESLIDVVELVPAD